jgi:hypothetical protein
MRLRKEVEADGARQDIKAVEVLLDIRELLRDIKVTLQDKHEKGVLNENHSTTNRRSGTSVSRHV